MDVGPRETEREWKCIVGKDIMEQLRHSIKLSSSVLSENTTWKNGGAPFKY